MRVAARTAAPGTRLVTPPRKRHPLIVQLFYGNNYCSLSFRIVSCVPTWAPTYCGQSGKIGKTSGQAKAVLGE